MYNSTRGKYIVNTIIRYNHSKSKSKSLDNINENVKSNNLQIFPEQLLKRKHAPHSFYIADQNVVATVSKYLLKNLKKDQTIAEVNPGPGMLTQQLIKSNALKVLLFESFDHFMPVLENLCKKFPEKLKLKKGDFVNIWKLDFQDKIDNGKRVTEFLQDIPKIPFENDVKMRLFAGVGNIRFFKYLINSLVFQSGLFSYGRCEMYIVMPPPLHIHLTCNNESGYLIYRATTILFQIMFEYELLTEIPREHFLPMRYEYHSSKSKKLDKINLINPNSLYFVKITPRRNLYELCDSKDIQALWYFVKQNCVSRKNRVIPNLEKWIPGCGPRLICEGGNEITFEKQKLFSKNIVNMPIKDMDIFTEFGDLTPLQILTLFWKFRSWPEFKDSSFLDSLDNSLLKMTNPVQERTDDIETKETNSTKQLIK